MFGSKEASEDKLKKMVEKGRTTSMLTLEEAAQK